MTIDLNASTVDLTAPSTPIGSVTPVAVTSTIFTASPANNTSAYVDFKWYFKFWSCNNQHC
jgi:hypothetical protein